MTETLKVLVVDDEPAVRSFLTALLEERGACELHQATDGEEAFRKVAALQPDVMITDLRMPRMSGETLAARALALQPELTVLVETGNPSLRGAVRLVRDGVYDYITKPFVLEDVEETLDRALACARQRRRSRTADAVVESLLAALASKDPYLKDHSYRVSRFAARLAGQCGLDPAGVERFAWAALVHDVGKISLPESILNKTEPLTAEEFEAVKLHPRWSVEIIRPLSPLRGGRECEEAIYHHHERWDGAGYPTGLEGKAIPLGARIISVCDAYDAMTSSRPYRGKLGRKDVSRELLAAAGSQFDGTLVRTFLDHLDEYEAAALEDKRWE